MVGPLALNVVHLVVAGQLAGCTKPPVYDGITTIIVHEQTLQGTARTELSGDKLLEATSCLYKTVEVQVEQSESEDLLQAMILLQVKDRHGDRMFEIFTDSNFKGNKGKYYRNDCILDIVRK